MKKFFLITMLMTFGFFAHVSSAFGQHWTGECGSHPGNLSLTGLIQMTGSYTLGTHVEIAAFYGDECRSDGESLIWSAGDNCWIAIMTICGDPGDVLSFKLYDHNTNEVLTNAVCSTTFTYTADDDTPEETLNFTYTAPTYAITAVADPATAATVTGGGNYEMGESVTLSYTINPGYTFLMWTDGDDNYVSDLDDYTFTVTGAASYKAKFSSELYLIYAIAHPSIGGTVAVSGATEGTNGFHNGDPCTLTATPAAGYSFLNWKDDADVVVSTSATYTFNVSEGGNYHAYFELGATTYTITTSCNPDGAGTVTGAGDYTGGSSCTLTATANPGSTFLMWTKDGTMVSENPTYTFTVTESAEYVANFTVETYLITASVTPSGAGTVTGVGGFAYNESCTLEATGNPGFVFEKWTLNGIDVSTDNPYTFNVTEAGDYVAHFTVGYVVTVTSEGGSGTITGAGTYPAGATVTLEATADPGCSFLFWKVGTDFIDDNPYTFTVTSDLDIIAYFSTETYIISVAADPDDAGTVSGAGGYTYGQTATLTATANEGYLFANWTLNGIVVSTDNPYSFNVTESGDYVANFDQGCIITTSCNPEGAGTLTGAGTYAVGASVTLTATPANPGSQFLFWTLNGEVVSEDPTYTFTATTDAEYVANFTVENYLITVSANPSNGGDVTGGGSFTYGQSCTLTATAAAGYVFNNWTLNGAEVATTPTYTFDVIEAGDYVANFVVGYDITASCEPASAGTITGTGVYTEGQTCTLSVVPTNSSYTFVFWTKDGEVVSDVETFSFTVTESAHYVANFTYETYIINATVNPDDAGEVTGGGAFMWGESCTLTATANTGYTFANWTLNGIEVSTSASYTFTVVESGDYVANFDVCATNTITTIANPTEGGELTGAGVYNTGSTCTLGATANPGYEFVNWTLNGEVVSTNASFSFTVTEDATYVANFSQDLYYVDVTANPEEGGETVGGGYFLYGHWCILHAIPADGYTFANWTVNGTVVCTEPIYRFIVTESVDVVANFTQDGYVITATANPTAGGTLTGAGVYIYGQSCTLTAYANTGYTFINWTKNGEQVSTNTAYTFTVTEAADYVANFSQNLYTISVEANPADAAYVFIQNGQNGQFAYGDVCTLRVATPNPGYTFVNWTLNGIEVSNDMTYTFVVTGNAHYVAQFANRTVTINAVAGREEVGEVIGAGVYNYGETVTMSAIPAEGYVFVNWTEKEVVVSDAATFSFIATEDRFLEAHFAIMTGVNENETFAVSLFPNPASNRMTVVTDQAEYQLDIYNIMGAMVRTMGNCSYNTEIDVENLPAGTYIIRLTNGNAVENRRFIKK